MRLFPSARTILSFLLVGTAAVGGAAASSSDLRSRKLQEVTSSYNVSDDTFVRDSSASKNYNSVTNLGVAYGASSNERITFVKFPIGFEVLNADSISSATLRMRVNQAPLITLTLNFFPCDTEDWSESVITWNDRPTYDNSTTALLTTRTLGPNDVNTWLDFNMSAPVIAAAQAQQETLSIVIQAAVPADLDPPSQVMKFDSKEDGNNIPVLDVTYVPGQATSPPTQALSTSPTIDYSQPNYPQLVSLGVDGSLDYVPYANEINVVQGSTANPAAVNTVPDFSGVGYKGGGVPIPFVRVNQTVSPSSGDRRGDIQTAIDAVAAMPLDSNGLRGAVLLEAGDYEVSYPGLNVYDSGVVIRGEGQGETGGTKIIYTSTVSDSYAVTLGFPNGGLEPDGATYAVTDSYVPVGSKSLSISDASTFAAGDRIIIKFQPNNDWLLHMSNMGQWGWTPESYQLEWRREVTVVNGNELTLNAPIVQALEAVYGGAIVYRYELLYNSNDVEIENVGIENIRIESVYANDLDENHGKHAVRVQRVSNGWIRQLTARYFWSGAVFLRRFSHAMTVEDTASVDPKGTLAGGRRYGFTIDDGDLHLIQRCFVRDGRHDFASGSRTSGPNVYADSLSVNSYNDIGPHERFSTGQLYDNIKTNINPIDDNDNGGEMNVQNRGSSGSGHGWAGAQIMFWNSNATRFRVHAPNGAMSWAVGMAGEKGGFLSNRVPEPNGIIQSQENFVDPRSLYYAQLKERLGANALRSVLLPNQKAGTIWDDLGTWMGDGLFGDAVVAWLDEDAVPVATGASLEIGGMVRDLTLLGNTPTYTWSVSAGPGSVTFGDSASLETTASFDTPGMYSLELLVRDGTLIEMASLEVSVQGPAVTSAPATSPSETPTTTASSSPTATLSGEPTPVESYEPSERPSAQPSLGPSVAPSAAPSPAPSAEPSSGPSLTPSDAPSPGPSPAPSDAPSPVPSPAPIGSTPEWVVILSNNFDKGFQNFTAGGSDVSWNRNERHTHNGSAGSIRIRDNTMESSAAFSDAFNVSAYTEIRVAFWFLMRSMEEGEDFFLESSVDGVGYTVVRQYIRGETIGNGEWYEVEEYIQLAPSTTELWIRFRCDANANNDRVYIDDVEISGK